MTTLTKDDPYESGVLLPEVHSRLVADLDTYARDANIPSRWITTPLKDTVSPKVVSWVRAFPQHAQGGRAGLCLMGPSALHVDYSCAVAGALVRNFIRAQVITLQQLLVMLADGDVPDPSCLLVPNLQVTGGARLVEWKVAQLLDYLVDRKMRDRQTVVCVASSDGIRRDLGEAFQHFLEASYRVVGIGE